jgi:fatty acid desaturase
MRRRRICSDESCVQNDEVTLPSPTLALMALVLFGTAVLWAIVGPWALIGTAMWSMLGVHIGQKAALARTNI